MPNFFNRLFKHHSNPTTIASDIPSEALFVDAQPPVTQKENQPEGSRIRQFLNCPHFSDGRSAGYQIHNTDDLAAQLRSLRSIFQREVSSVQEQMKEELLDKQKKLLHIGKLLPTQSQMLNMEVEALQEKVAELNHEKELSVDGEGWISSALNEFERGYKKGLQDYLDEKTFMSRNLI